MKPDSRERVLRFRIRGLLIGFMVGLALSGITAFPLPAELRMLSHWMGIPDGASASAYGGLTAWIITVRDALTFTEGKYPFLFYGYDWLAFAHLVIAVMFVGPYKDPVRNIWVIQWGMIACGAVVVLALVAGPIRGIPFGWQLIDCSFGVVGIVPLWLCQRWIKELEGVNAEAYA